MNEHIPTDYAVLIVSEILLEKVLINRATFDELAKRLKESDSHISQARSA